MKRSVVIVVIGRFNRRNERAKRIVGCRSRLWRHLRKFRLLRFTTVTTFTVFHYAPRCPTYVYYVPHYGFCYYAIK
jgi:hypothetical protein